MENLNDVEFGSDKSTEEAPILVAQRYLNIYRQIHIFNKEKRDQFDDELLALPQNITDFFKRMPGGRLLVEHIEEVKTERGISFVKSNKEDFTTGGESNSQATPSTTAQPIAGGTIAIDASFAQTLAQSMANAFKQIPTPTSSNNITAPSPKDFSKAFDLIAEEIKMSRTSLLDVLQEMHTITSSLIASQVSIARTLERLLTNQNTPTSVRSDNEKNFSTEKETPREVIKEKKEVSEHISHPQNRESNHSEGGTKNITAPSAQKPFNEHIVHPITVSQGSSQMPQNDEMNRKKKKKKKNKNADNNLNQGVQNTTQQPIMRPQQNSEQPQPSLAIKSEKLIPELGGIIHNAAVNHLDDDILQTEKEQSGTVFENNIADLAPRVNEVDSLSSLTEYTETQPITPDDLSEHVDSDIDLDNLADLINSNSSNTHTNISNNTKTFFTPEHISPTDISDDGLDFSLPQQVSALSDDLASSAGKTESLDNIFSNDGLNFALPEQNLNHVDEEPLPQQTPERNLDNLFNGDGLDFVLPEQSSVQEESLSEPKEKTESLDSIFSNDGLDFALPEQNLNHVDEEPLPQQTSERNLDNLFNGDGLDFVLPEQPSIQKESSSKENTESLDSIFNGDGLDFALPEQGVSVDHDEETIQTPISGFDTIFEENIPSSDETKQVFSMENEETTYQSLDSIFENHDTEEFSLPENTTLDEITPTSSVDDLDSIFNDNKSDTLSHEQEQSVNLDDNLTSLDTLAAQISATNTDTEPQIEEETIHNEPAQEQTQSRYSEELDRIRAALTSDSVDISSLDQPIELDDYDDDEGILNKDDNVIDNLVQSSNLSSPNLPQQNTPPTDETNSDDWDWEYVDENGNPVSASDDDEEWEWEYVEDDEAENESDNNNK